MAGFSDLIPAAMPYLATEKLAGVTGATWQWSYDVTDDAGDAVNMTTGFTGVCQIRKPDGTLIVAPAVTFPSAGLVTCTVTAANTTSLTAGHYYHELEITRTSDSVVIKVVGGGRATFDVYHEVVA